MSKHQFEVLLCNHTNLYSMLYRQGHVKCCSPKITLNNLQIKNVFSSVKKKLEENIFKIHEVP